MGPWLLTFKDCEYYTRKASRHSEGWEDREELSHTLGTRLWHKRHMGSAQVFTKIILAHRHSSLDSVTPMSSNIATFAHLPGIKRPPPRHRSRCIDLPHRMMVVRASGSFPEQQTSLAAALVSKPGDVFAEFHTPWATAASLLAFNGILGRLLEKPRSVGERNEIFKAPWLATPGINATTLHVWFRRHTRKWLLGVNIRPESMVRLGTAMYTFWKQVSVHLLSLI